MGSTQLCRAYDNLATPTRPSPMNWQRRGCVNILQAAFYFYDDNKFAPKVFARRPSRDQPPCVGLAALYFRISLYFQRDISRGVCACAQNSDLFVVCDVNAGSCSSFPMLRACARSRHLMRFGQRPVLFSQTILLLCIIILVPQARPGGASTGLICAGCRLSCQCVRIRSGLLGGICSE